MKLKLEDIKDDNTIINMLIAEKVFGCEIGICSEDFPILEQRFKNGEVHALHRYSTSIDNAWEIVGKMESLGYNYRIQKDSVSFWLGCCHEIGGEVAKNKPLAICLAALLVLEVVE